MLIIVNKDVIIKLFKKTTDNLSYIYLLKYNVSLLVHGCKNQNISNNVNIRVHVNLCKKVVYITIRYTHNMNKIRRCINGNSSPVNRSFRTLSK